MYKLQEKVEFLISNKAALATEKVNDWLEKNQDKRIISIIPVMGYSDLKLMVGCMVRYVERVHIPDEVPDARD